MPIKASAKKAMRQALTRRERNRRRLQTMRTAIKTVKRAGTGAEAALPKAYQAIDKAAKRGVIKKNTAARYKSRLARRLAAGAAKS